MHIGIAKSLAEIIIVFVFDAFILLNIKENFAFLFDENRFEIFLVNLGAKI